MILPEYPFAVQNRRVAKYRSTPGVDGPNGRMMFYSSELAALMKSYL